MWLISFQHVASQEQVMEFMQKIFSFDGVRYTSISDLSEDIMTTARSRVQGIIDKMSVDPNLWPWNRGRRSSTLEIPTLAS